MHVVIVHAPLAPSSASFALCSIWRIYYESTAHPWRILKWEGRKHLHSGLRWPIFYQKYFQTRSQGWGTKHESTIHSRKNICTAIISLKTSLKKILTDAKASRTQHCYLFWTRAKIYWKQIWFLHWALFFNRVNWLTAFNLVFLVKVTVFQK